MEVVAAIRGRWAARAFTAEPVDRATIEGLIEAATRAPTAMNEQPWEFCVIQNRDRLSQISSQAVAHMADPGMRASLAQRHHGGLDDPHFNIFYHAPALIVISAKLGPWAVEDAALAAENLMLAAYDKGLGSCWIGLAQRWLETEEGRRAIGTPDGYAPVAPIIVGHAAGRSVQAPRRPATVRWLD